jgi:hypothetical protein
MSFPCRFTEEEFAEIKKREYEAETENLKSRLGIRKLETEIQNLKTRIAKLENQKAQTKKVCSEANCTLELLQCSNSTALSENN